MKKIVAVLSFLLILAGSVYAERPDPNKLYMSGPLTYGGDGCPQGSVAGDLSDDGLAMTLYFDAYSVEVLGGSRRPFAKKTCGLSIPLNIPSGWQFSIVDITYRGLVFLEEDVKAFLTSKYYFMGQPYGPVRETEWVGEVDEDFTVVDSLGVESLNTQWWSPCNVQRNLSLDTTIKANNLRNRDGYGSIANESTNLNITHIYQLQWRRCSTNSSKPAFESSDYLFNRENKRNWPLFQKSRLDFNLLDD